MRALVLAAALSASAWAGTAAAQPTAPGSAAISRTPSLVGLSPGASPRQQSQAGMSRLQLEGDTAPQEQLPSPRVSDDDNTLVCNLWATRVQLLQPVCN